LFFSRRANKERRNADMVILPSRFGELARPSNAHSAMSLRVLPLLYINLGGEMMYILNQRLKAQKIALDKAHKVITDIVSTMFNVRFVEELFKPQELYSKKAVRSIFEKLTHASIMRLNAASMDKLYDLMTMVVKYQTFMCSSPGDLLAVTLNHLDAIGSYVATARPVHAQVQNVLGVLLKNYQNLSVGEYQMIRYALLGFFQDLRIRVSVFLKTGVQHPNGLFEIPTSGPVPPGFEVPGTVREFGPGSVLLRETPFETGCNYEPAQRSAQGFHRGTRLGTNIYSPNEQIPRSLLEGQGSVPAASLNATEESVEALTSPDSSARAELGLLLQLVGHDERRDTSEFSLNLFFEGDGAASDRDACDGGLLVTIDAPKAS
ncbi:unnamed protein product, partial [Ixodes pacificus]